MATQETQQLDNIISSRRAIMLGGGALAALALAGTANAQAATVSDNDVLNFALNLEYLEAEFYTLAATGQTLAQFGVSTNAGASTSPITFAPATVVTKAGTSSGSASVNVSATKVPFALPAVEAYALELAAEERNHVNDLRAALGASAVAEPNIDLYNSFLALGTAIGVPGFDPFASDYTFLLGSYIFEDVGVSAYHGGAALLSSTVALGAAAKIHAVEAYHAGIIRTTIYGLDQNPTPIGPPSTLRVLTQRISQTRAMLDGTLSGTPDDVGLNIANVALNGTAATYVGSTIVNADANAIGWARTPNQVLNIVYATPGAGVTSGGFFPAGLNGNVKTT